MLYNRCTGIYKFGNNTNPRHIRRRSNLGHIFRGKKCVLWAGKYGNILIVWWSRDEWFEVSIPYIARQSEFTRYHLYSLLIPKIQDNVIPNILLQTVLRMYYLFYMCCNYLMLHCGILIFTVFFLLISWPWCEWNFLKNAWQWNDQCSLYSFVWGVYAVKPLASVRSQSLFWVSYV